MNTNEQLPIVKISYEKPTAVDLGPTAPVIGASCAPGVEFDPGGDCFEVGNSAAQSCYGAGNSPGGDCQLQGNNVQNGVVAP